MGLAPDGGLMLPEHYPQIGRETLDKWRGLAYPELAFEIMRLFVTDIPEDDLRDILNRTYTEAAFGTKKSPRPHAFRRHQNPSLVQRPDAGVQRYGDAVFGQCV